MGKIEVEYEELFSYGGVCGDIAITKIITTYPWNDRCIQYSLDIEGMICYDSIFDCIEYYEHLKEKLLRWLKEGEAEPSKRYTPNYQSYPIEIYQQFDMDNVPVGYMVYIGELKSDELYDTYWKMEGIINQLKTINI